MTQESLRWKRQFLIWECCIHLSNEKFTMLLIALLQSLYFLAIVRYMDASLAKANWSISKMRRWGWEIWQNFIYYFQITNSIICWRLYIYMYFIDYVQLGANQNSNKNLKMKLIDLTIAASICNLLSENVWQYSKA